MTNFRSRISSRFVQVITILILLQAVLVLLLVSGCDQSPAAKAAPPRPVNVITAKPEQPPVLSFAGVVQARVETDLAFRALGRVISRSVDVGDLVHRGDVVAELDPLALQLAVTSAEADLRNAQAQHENATATEKRKRNLASANTGSVADSEVAEQGLKSAEADVGQAQARLDKAREQLGYTRLKAEFDGVVTATSVQVGQTVTAGQTVLRLAGLDRRDVVIDVPEAQVGSLRLGMRFDIALQLDDTLRTAGVLREIGPEADANTRTHRLKIALNEAPEVFRLGTVVTATAASQASTSAIALPASAILERDGADHVWVIDRAKLTISVRPVRLEARPAGAARVRVLSGLQNGEEVAVAGANELADGQRIRPAQELPQ
ncbi:RND family efflux transporter, MFP subunit [Mesorhizobium ventifaucium]|uniref:RND family efflux transporter, MFP subunit n=1 Tax=Mesorhizobium ventifaucium TaxID=666020 RepID=A0ABM9E3E5_9HYPH|nr:RND family efflux transporter, MFP subunit [Mesorhizobium ventifaucium]